MRKIKLTMNAGQRSLELDPHGLALTIHGLLDTISDQLTQSNVDENGRTLCVADAARTLTRILTDHLESEDAPRLRAAS